MCLCREGCVRWTWWLGLRNEELAALLALAHGLLMYHDFWNWRCGLHPQQNLLYRLVLKLALRLTGSAISAAPSRWKMSR